MTTGKDKTTINLNTESFAFLDSSRFRTTEWCKARITALALLDRTSNSSSYLLLLVNVTPRYLNFSICFNDTPPTCREHWTGFFERCRTSVLEVLIFIPAMSHAAANAVFEARFRESQKNWFICKKQPANFASSDCDTLIGSPELVNPVHVNYEKERWQNTLLPKTNTHMK